MENLRILVNATTITVGGGVQAAISFIEFAAGLGPKGPTFVFAVSRPVYEGLAASLRSDRRVRVFQDSPAHPLKGRHVRKVLLGLEKEFLPHLVYSIGFPSYIFFQGPEVGRYTNGWEICPFPLAMSCLPPWERFIRACKSFYRLRWARSAHYFETQTDIAKAGIVRKLRVLPEHVLVLPNSVNRRFVEASRAMQSHLQPQKPARVFCLSPAYRHKNLAIIPEVAGVLARSYKLECKFVLTLPAKDWQHIANLAERRDVLKYVDNVGPLTLDGCVEQYRVADCLFLPTLAEIFSVTYLEAMAMRVPIVTTDLDFARSVCKDAALYYDPLSPEDAAKAIHLVFTDAATRCELIQKGLRRLRDFPDPHQKHTSLVNWLVQMAAREKEKMGRS